MNVRVVWKNGYDSLLFWGGAFFHCLNFVTNTTFQTVGLHLSSAKEARNLMDPLI